MAFDHSFGLVELLVSRGFTWNTSKGGGLKQPSYLPFTLTFHQQFLFVIALLNVRHITSDEADDGVLDLKW